MQPHKKDPVPPPKHDNNSLLSVLEAFDQLVDREQHAKKAYNERKGVDLNAPEAARRKPKPIRKEEEGIHHNKERITPVFEGIPPKTTSHQHEKRQSHHTASEPHERKEPHHTRKEEPQKQPNNFNKQESAFKPHHSHPYRDSYRPSRQFERQKYGSNFRSPPKKQGFPIRFQESMTYQGVCITICFGNVNLEEDVPSDTALTIPFPTIDWQSNLIIDLQRRTDKYISSDLEQFLKRSNESNYRIGDVLDIGSLHQIPYEHVYMMKSPNNESITQFLLDKHFKSVKKLIERTATDHVIGVVFGEWVWGRLEPYEAGSIMLKAIVEGIKSLGTVKELRSVRICIEKKADYKGYAKAFREISDQYLDAFYRE